MNPRFIAGLERTLMAAALLGVLAALGYGFVDLVRQAL
ncbi:MAG: hypothetical protein QOK42_2495 [Frankiaceae bacterium]|jgi:hypothetical protein|nr:hypothetical protein [Frankiaceae bacterium]MDX6224782.1 hypothetical protein [Frankiales bacterium]MDX6275647.1 hypothetical protein [Frankiales bacterium]